MDMIIMTNGQMGTCSFERSSNFTYNFSFKPCSSYGFLNSWRPFNGVPLNLKSEKKMRTFGFGLRIKAAVDGDSDNRLVGGGILEKEFEFKPSFGEYLKAMESVKSAGERKHTRKLSEGESADVLMEDNGMSSVRNERRGRLKFNENDDLRAVEHVRISRKHVVGSNSVRTERRGKLKFKENDDLRDDEDGEISRKGVVNRKVHNERGIRESNFKLNSKGNTAATNVKRDMREVTRGREQLDNRTGGKNSKLEDQFSGKVQRLRNVRERSIVDDGVGSGRASGIRKEFAFGQNFPEEFKTNSEEAGTSRDNLGGVSNRAQSGQYIAREFKEDKPFIRRTNPNFRNRDDEDNFEVERAALKYTSWDKMGGKRLSNRAQSDNNIAKEFKEDKPFIRRTNRAFLDHDEEDNFEVERAASKYTSWDKMGGKLVSDRAQSDKYIAKEFKEDKPSIRRTNRAFLDSDDEDNFKMERAAFKSLEEYNGDPVKPRTTKREVEERLQHLAKCLNGADIDMPEWIFSKMIRSAKIKYTDHSIVRLIQLLGKFGNWRRVLQLIEWLQMRERFKPYRPRYIYTTALNELGKAQRPVEALNLFHEMQQQMSTYPDLVAYHCIAVTLGQAGHMEQLFDVIDTMRSPPKKKFKTAVLDKWDPRLEPDIVVYNAVLNACVQRKQFEGAFWVLQQMKEQGLQPSTVTYGLVMEVMFACEKYNLVHEFFRKVHKNSVPNTLVYRVLVNTLWKEGKTDEAKLAVKDMERRGIVGSAALYYDLARCLCSAGRCEEALRQIEKICRVANKPLVVTYTGLIQACLDAGNLQNAEYIFNEMKQFCSPNLVTYNVMLKAYIDNGLFEDAKEFFHKMMEDGYNIKDRHDYKAKVVPDIYTFNTMLDACVAEKSWDDFQYVYRKMFHHGFHFNGKRHLRMVLVASRAGKVEPLEMTWKHLNQKGRIPSPNLIKERFCLMLEKDDPKSALACIMNYPMGESHQGAWLNLFKANADRISSDTIVQLKYEVSMLFTDTSLPNPVLQNLLKACLDFLYFREKNAESNQTESLCESELQTKSMS